MIDAITNLFGEFTALAPMIIIMAAALFAPGIQLVVKKRTVTWAFSLIMVLISLAINVNEYFFSLSFSL